ncbi:MAG: hypothetical protein COU47_02695 [Candidatus Niyogibacteria bacterium CG10_big_fil_rev_8_21_14_0_10_46_36]|uniref:Uncharacterized protein n=1 Tax=Candidatus Niyogibacteria bacterium CG10_big_fil_rev_8_21_14_0_10_46_36 TaxID=1974726 RepID=A0A2H0TD37_9BACT|nr:MAG: hypothetical protein COU47_02695 [Candidatus Niyogibacteria bacterium CG10_big_fil_rev_8_21_14_0_10_46_36]
MTEQAQSVTIYSNGGGYYFVGTSKIKHVCDDFAPMMFTLPHNVESRHDLPDGVVRTIEDVVRVYFSKEEEILDPSTKFAIDYR